MKYLIIFALLLTACNPCPKQYRQDLKYGDRVLVTDGFFKGQTGTIKSQREVYRPEHCNLEGFRVELDNDKSNVDIEQGVLVKKPTSPIKCDGFPFCELPR